MCFNVRGPKSSKNYFSWSMPEQQCRYRESYRATGIRFTGTLKSSVWNPTTLSIPGSRCTHFLWLGPCNIWVASRYISILERGRTTFLRNHETYWRWVLLISSSRNSRYLNDIKCFAWEEALCPWKQEHVPRHLLWRPVSMYGKGRGKSGRGQEESLLLCNFKHETILFTSSVYHKPRTSKSSVSYRSGLRSFLVFLRSCTRAEISNYANPC